MKDSRQQDFDFDEQVDAIDIPKQAKPSSLPGQVTALTEVLYYLISLELERSELGPQDRARLLSRAAMLKAHRKIGVLHDTGWYDDVPAVPENI